MLDRLGEHVRHPSAEIARQFGEESGVERLFAGRDPVGFCDAVRGAHRETDGTPLPILGSVDFERQ
jgi:hypothetical protein